MPLLQSQWMLVAKLFKCNNLLHASLPYTLLCKRKTINSQHGDYVEIKLSLVILQKKVDHLGGFFSQNGPWYHKIVSEKKFQHLTLFDNYSKYRIWIFEFWHFPSIFVQLKLTCLVTLFDRKLQVFKNSPKCTILAFLINFCPLKM